MTAVLPSTTRMPELASTPVRRIMRPGVVAIPGATSLLEVARTMRAHGVHAVLVLDPGAPGPVGWVTSEALIGRLLDYSPFVPAGDVATELPTTIAPSAPVADAIRALRRPGVTHLLVTTGVAAVPLGVVSDTDVVAFAASHG
jgi:CBS domain-containing protein